MDLAIYISAFLAVSIGLLHSFLGERYILVRLFRRGDLPRLYGGTDFTARTLRFAWHITTIAWWGFAAILLQLAEGAVSAKGVALSIGITFLSTSLVTLIISRARHFAWPVFLFIGGIAFYVAVA